MRKRLELYQGDLIKANQGPLKKGKQARDDLARYNKVLSEGGSIDAPEVRNLNPGARRRLSSAQKREISDGSNRANFHWRV